MWKRVSSYGDDYVPRSLLEQQIVLQSWYYEWHGGEPDPGQLPEGYRQLSNDKRRAVRALHPCDRLVRVAIVLLAAWVATLVVHAL